MNIPPPKKLPLSVRLGTELLVDAVAITASSIRVTKSKKIEINRSLQDLGLHLTTALTCDTAVLLSLNPSPSSISSTLNTNMPSYIFQNGNFSIAKRALSFTYKAVFLGTIGAISGALCCMNNNRHSKIRTSPSPSPSPYDEAIVWGSFLALSSNLRGQIVTHFECQFLPNVNINATLLCFILRFSNNAIGAIMMPWWSSFIKNAKRKTQNAKHRN
jgi:hypothetical protein